MKTSEQPAARECGRTERDRFWLGHLERIERDGVAAKDYAVREGLSVQAIYQARKRLVARGTWPAVPALAAPWALRVRLPSGAVLEWSALPEATLLATILGAVSTPR